MTEIPKWLCSKIDENGLAKIREAVEKAELKTSAEIVPVLVRRSSALAHVPMTLFLLLALIWVTLFPYIPITHTGNTATIAEIVGIVGAFAMSFVLAKLKLFQRLLVPIVDQRAQVHARAELEFHGSNIKSTRDSTGILIFVSMLERQAVILADKSIADKFPPNTWTEIINGLLKKISAGDVTGAFAWAIERSGELVQPYFPVKADDTNELSNDLIIKE